MKTATHASPYALGTGMGNMGQEWGAVTGTIMQQSWETILGGLGWLAHYPAPQVCIPRQDLTSHQSIWFSQQRSTRLAVGIITLNLGIIWVLHQNGWIQNFEIT